MAMRPPQETRDRALKQAKDAWEKNRRTSIPPAELRKLEKQIVEKHLPRIYENK